MTTPVTRFAPSPTGYLHLGHVASAAYVWGLGRRLGANVLLRIEDHDTGRSRAEYDAAIREDLRWLGFEWDGEPERQSERRELYDAAIARLGAVTEVYACDCTRARVAAGAGAGGTAGIEPVYDGLCRGRGLAMAAKGVGIRVRLAEGEERFDDLVLGPLAQVPARQCGDVLLRDRHGDVTYQLGVVVDDLRQGVNLVIRGQDLTESTGRQIALARLLGREQPAVFAHHPLLVDEGGKKLSKRFFAEGVARRRAAGERPEAVLGEAVFLAGLTARREEVAARELPGLFGELAARAAGKVGAERG